MVPEHFRRPPLGLAPVVAEPAFHHRSVRRWHRREFHTAANTSAAGGAGGAVVAAQCRRCDNRRLPGQPLHDGADLLRGLPRRRMDAALSAAAFPVSLVVEMARARLRSRVEAVPGRLPGVWHRVRIGWALPARILLANRD